MKHIILEKVRKAIVESDHDRTTRLVDGRSWTGLPQSTRPIRSRGLETLEEKRLEDELDELVNQISDSLWYVILQHTDPPQIRKSVRAPVETRFAILVKADEPTTRSHEAYVRRSKTGKLEQIKKKGVKIKEIEQEKVRHEESEKELGTKVGELILIPGTDKEVTVSAVGKDGVTSKDELGNRYQVLHDNIQKPGEESKKTESEESKEESKKTESEEGKEEGEIKKIYNLKEFGFSGEVKDRSGVTTKIKKELGLLADKVVVDGKGILSVKVVSVKDLGGNIRAFYATKEKQIEVSRRYASKFAHEYGHFVFFESLRASKLKDNGVESEPEYGNPIVESISPDIKKQADGSSVKLGLGLLENTSEAKLAITNGMKLYLERLKNLISPDSVEYTALSELFTDLDKFYCSKISDYKYILDWDYVFDTSEMFSRAYSTYVYGKGDHSGPAFEQDRDYINLVKKWGDKYLKTGLVKSEI
jgi:hypothetical protein